MPRPKPVRRKCLKCGKDTKAWKRPPEFKPRENPEAEFLKHSLCTSCMGLGTKKSDGEPNLYEQRIRNRVSPQMAERLLRLAGRLLTRGKDPERILAVAEFVPDPTDVLARHFKPPFSEETVESLFGNTDKLWRKVWSIDVQHGPVETREEALLAWIRTTSQGRAAWVKDQLSLIKALTIPRLFKSEGALRKAATKFRQRYQPPKDAQGNGES